MGPAAGSAAWQALEAPEPYESPRGSGKPIHRGATGPDGRGKVLGGQAKAK